MGLNLKHFCLRDITPATLIIFIAHIMISCTMAAYQNLICGDKQSQAAQRNVANGLFPKFEV